MAPRTEGTRLPPGVHSGLGETSASFAIPSPYIPQDFQSKLYLGVPNYFSASFALSRTPLNLEQRTVEGADLTFGAMQFELYALPAAVPVIVGREPGFDPEANRFVTYDHIGIKIDLGAIGKERIGRSQFTIFRYDQGPFHGNYISTGLFPSQPFIVEGRTVSRHGKYTPSIPTNLLVMPEPRPDDLGMNIVRTLGKFKAGKSRTVNIAYVYAAGRNDRGIPELNERNLRAFPTFMVVEEITRKQAAQQRAERHDITVTTPELKGVSVERVADGAMRTPGLDDLLLVWDRKMALTSSQTQLYALDPKGRSVPSTYAWIAKDINTRAGKTDREAVAIDPARVATELEGTLTLLIGREPDRLRERAQASNVKNPHVLVLPYADVSGVHAALVYSTHGDQQELQVYDLGSANGTFVNKTKLAANTATLLQHGAAVSLSTEPHLSFRVAFPQGKKVSTTLDAAAQLDTSSGRGGRTRLKQ